MAITSKDFLAYQWVALMKAWDEMWDWSPVNPKQAIFTIMVFAAIWYMAVQLGVQEELTTPFGIITVIVPLTVGLAFFIGQRFMAPVHIVNELRVECDRLAKELDVLNTPGVSLDLYTIQEDIEGIQTAFLEVTGGSAKRGRVEVFGTAVCATNTDYGRFILYLASGPAMGFSVHCGESHRSIPVIRYNPREVGPAIQVAVPLQIPTTDIIRGNEFSLTVAAFGGTQPAVLELRFAVDYETRRLWVRKEGSAKILRSDPLEASPRQIDEQFKKGFE